MKSTYTRPPVSSMCSQNLIDTSQLKPLRFHLEGGQERWSQGLGGGGREVLWDEEAERSEVKRGGGEGSVKTQG